MAPARRSHAAPCSPIAGDLGRARAILADPGHPLRPPLREQKAWRDEFALGLAPAAAQCGAYLRDARAIAALREYIAPETMRKLEAQLRRTHRLARQGLKLFAELPPPEMNAQGEDAMIAKLCAPLPKLIATSVSPEN